MSKSWLWVFVVWVISLLVGVLWGLSSLPGVNAARITETLAKYSLTLLVLLILVLVLLTLAYAIFKLGRTTDALASIAAHQSKLLAANQRTYLCIDPLGIVVTVGGTRVLGHVGIRNVGNQAAHSVRWFLDIKASPDDAEKSFPLGPMSGDLVAPPGTTLRRATKATMAIADLIEKRFERCQSTFRRRARVLVRLGSGSLSRWIGQRTLDTLLPSVQLGYARRWTDRQI